MGKRSNNTGQITKKYYTTKSGKRTLKYRVRIYEGIKEIDGEYKPSYINVGNCLYDTKQKAEYALEKYRREHNIDDKTGKIVRITFEEVFTMYMEHIKNSQKIFSNKFNERSSKLKAYITTYRHSKELYDIDITEIKYLHFQELIDKSDFQLSTIKHLKSHWAMVMESAVKLDYINFNPAHLIRIKDYKNPARESRTNPHVILTNEELTIIKNNIDTRAGKIFYLLLMTGLRISELRDLKISDIDLENKAIFIRKAKTERGKRTVPIHDDIYDIILYFINEIPKKNYEKQEKVYLIRTVRNGYFGDDHFRRSILYPGREAMGLRKEITFHSFRHTFINKWASQKLDRNILFNVVGHNKLTPKHVTDIYLSELPLSVCANEMKKYNLLFDIPV